MKPSYDAIVIGSGFGGAVTACRLAQAGAQVALLERGRRYPRGGFPRDFRDPRQGWLFQVEQGLFDVKPVNEMMILQAAGLGGGSLIYANVHMRPPADVFETGWPRGYSRPALDPYYDLAAFMLDVRTIAGAPRGEPSKTKRMREAAQRLGRGDQWFLPNLAVTFGTAGAEPQTNKFDVPQEGCRYCGECIIGCNYHSKNTLDLNYLAVAERRGCAIATRAEVSTIAPGAMGYRVEYVDHEAGETKRVDARWVFVCAGAVNTTELLLRCRDQYKTLPLLGRRLGEGYSANGDFLAFAFGTTEPFEPSGGPTITSALVYDRAEGQARTWFLLEDGGFPAQLGTVARVLDLGSGWFAVTPRSRAEVANALADAVATSSAPGASDQHNGAFFMMGRDRGLGRVRLLPLSHRLFVEWRANEELTLYEAQSRLASDVARALGGHAVDNPFWHWLRLPMTVHNLGGCTMADGPAEGVVDAFGECFAYPGLFVCDASILPRATGTNPAATIAAVAERNVEHFIRERLGQPGWVAPERKLAPVVREPLGTTSIPAEGTAPPSDATPGLLLREVVQGYFARTSDGSSLWMEAHVSLAIGSLERLFLGNSATAGVTGTIAVTGLTPDAGSRIASGTVRFETSSDGRTTATFSVAFPDAQGRPLVLEGSRPALHPDDPQRVGALIREASDATVAIAKGTLRFPMPDAVSDLRTIEIVGQVEPLALASLVARGAARLAAILGKRHASLLLEYLRTKVGGCAKEGA